MRKLLLLLLVVLSWDSYAQQTQSVLTPPPPGFRWEYALDLDNDGFATFDITGYINRYKADLSTGFYHLNLTGYTLQMQALQSDNITYVPITTPTYTNTVINIQHCEITVAPYNASIQSILNTTSHSLRTLPYNGDLDGDGIINSLEDLNSNLNLYDENTDGDGIPNFWDNDDDGDGILTINEDYNGNGSVLDDDMNSNGIIDYLDNLARGPLNLNLKLFIEGYYTGSSTMKSVKNNQDGVSPLTDVENITIELHNTTNPFTLVASTTSMLKTNGNVICSFPTASIGSYYIAVKSRNGLETWSATPQSIGTTAVTYNFSSAANKAFGSNMKNLGSGVFGFYSGDINHDESIDATDAPDLMNDIDNSAFGIKATDLNGDGSVDATDAPYYFDNQDNSTYSIHP